MRLCVLFGLAFASPLLATESTTSIFLSPRAEGRGGTGLAAYDSNESAQLNPAILAETSLRFSLRPFELKTAVGQNAITTAQDIMSLSTSSDSGLGFLRTFDNKFGKRQFLQGQVGLFSLRIKSFELQPILSNNSWLELRDPTTPQANFYSDTYMGMQASLGLSFGKAWQLGLSLRSLKRTYIKGEMSFTDILEFAPPSSVKFDDYAPLRQGQGYGADLGLVWQATAAWRVAMSVQNIGDTSFTATGSNGLAPFPLQQSINLGGLYRHKLGMWDLDLMVDAYDLLNRKGENLLRLVHWGAELGRSLYGKTHDVGLLAGIQEGYFTGGAFLDFWLGRMELSNYAVEIGEGVGQRMDRRWALSMQTSVSF